MSVGEENKKRKKSKKIKKSKFISFEQEILSRDAAEILLSQYKGDAPHVSGEDVGTNEGILKPEGRKKEKKKKHKDRNEQEVRENQIDTNGEPVNNGLETNSDLKKKKSKSKDRAKESILSPDTYEPTSTLDEHVPNATKKKKRKKDKISDVPVDCSQDESVPSKKQKKKSTNANVESESTDTKHAEENDVDPSHQQEKKTESKRQQKRKKHQHLLEEKKLKVELALQHKALNYLSKWKHSRDSWKFEKLKQIWLQQNIFDSTKIPSEFWETSLEYFTGAKGCAKSVLLDKAMKIITAAEDQKKRSPTNDENETTEQDVGTAESLDDSQDEELIKLKRARDVMQYLQE